MKYILEGLPTSVATRLLSFCSGVRGQMLRWLRVSSTTVHSNQTQNGHFGIFMNGKVNTKTVTQVRQEYLLIYTNICIFSGKNARKTHWHILKFWLSIITDIYHVHEQLHKY